MYKDILRWQTGDDDRVFFFDTPPVRFGNSSCVQPTTTTTQAEPPKVVSEEQEDYIRSGQADQEIAEANRISQNLQQGRADAREQDRKDALSGGRPEFKGIDEFQEDVKKLYGQDFTKELTDLQDKTAEGFKNLFRGPVDLKTTSPFDAV